MNNFRNSDVISVLTDQFPKATCRESDPEIFFSSLAKAKMICSFCPHIIECRDTARQREEKFGTFGGETEDERRKWLKRNNRGKPRPLGINQINAPHVVKLRKQGLPNYQIAKALGINGKGVDRALAHAKRMGISA